MIKVFFSVGDGGEVQEKGFSSEAQFENWCTRMEDSYGFTGWEIHHTRYV